MELDHRRSGRRVQNELVFRAVNEKLRELNVQFEGFANETAVFVCECDQLECIEQIDLGVTAFDEIRALPRRFFVVPGHEAPDIEDVVGRNDRYYVVEKKVVAD